VTPPQAGKVAGKLFLLCLAVYLLSGPVFFGYDGEIMYRVSESLVLRHSLLVTDPIYHTSQPWSPYGIGTSIMLLPFVAVGQLLLHDPRAFVLLYLPIITALTVVAFNALLIELGVSWTRALWLSVILAFGTLAWHYTGVLFSEPLVGLVIVTSLLALLRYRRTTRTRWLALAGLAGALAVLARFDSAFLVIPPVGLFVLVLTLNGRREWWPRVVDLVAYVAPVIAGIGLSLAYDVLRYGAPLRGPYESDAQGFSEPLLKGLYGLLLSPGVGIFVYVPVLALAVIGFASLFRRYRAVAIVIAALVGLRLLFFARWWDWSGGATEGPRFLVPLIPVMLLPVAFVYGRRWRVAIAVLAAGGFIVELVSQLVPYGLVYGSIVPRIAAGLGLCSCVPPPSPTGHAVHEVMAFDWQWSPFVWQFRYLARGVTAPAWGPIAWFALPAMLIAVAVLGRRLLRLTRSLDASSRDERGGAQAA
jgi:hypothetical protein